MKFVNASGGRMKHFGARDVTFRAKDSDTTAMMGMEFQVSEVRKPLAAVWRIAEKGNLVQFGPGEADNFVKNVKTGEKVMLRRKGGSYVMAVEFMKKFDVGSFQRQA